MSFIELENIRKTFDGKEVLKGISLSIEEGEFATFLGPSGCGKTTLLRCIIGLENPDGGRILVQGQDLTQVHPRERGMSMIFQHYCLFPTMTLEDNVSFGLRMKKEPREKIQAKVDRVLAMMNILDHKEKFPYQLSGGEQQRAALARGLVMDPRLILLDEPFSAIDAKMRKELQYYLRKIHREMNMTSIFVTHDQEEAMAMSDTIHIFNSGKLEQSGQPREIYLEPRTDFVTEFIGSYNIFTRDQAESYLGLDEKLALRPEVIDFTSEEPGDYGDYLVLEGQVLDLIPKGAILRYVVGLGPDYRIDVDRLFELGDLKEEGEPVFLKFYKQDLVRQGEGI